MNRVKYFEEFDTSQDDTLDNVATITKKILKEFKNLTD
jgi:hypothetical protein